MNNNRVIVLGGNVPHCSLIKELKRRGYYTILIDYLDNPPAKEIADIHVQESTLDQETVLRVAEEFRPKYIIDACIDRPIPVVGYVSEKLGLYCPYTYEVSLIGTNKNKMKKMMHENNIPTSRYVKVTDIEQISDINLNYPLIIKPSDASGSIGINKIDSPDQLEANLKLALYYSRNGQAIVEEFVSGKEIQVDCFVKNGKCNILVLKEKRKSRIDVLTLSYGSMIPADITEVVKDKIQEVCDNIVKTLNLKDCPFFMQAIVSDRDVFVIEFGLRIGGMLSYKMIGQIAGFDVIAAAVDAFTGCVPDISVKPMSGIYTTNHIFPKKGVVAEITGAEKLLKEKIIDNYTQFATMGMESGGNLESRDRLASFVITADTLDEYYVKMKTAVQTFNVIDPDGNSIMRKDIYNLNID